MADFTVVIADPKARKAYQRTVEQGASQLVGKKLGEQVPGGPLGLEGYILQLTGGSDKEGFPMRADMEGAARKRVLLSAGPGFHPVREGERQRKSVRGNAISKDIVQVNAKIVTPGKRPVEELFNIKPKEEKKEEAKEAKPEPAEAKNVPAEKPAAEKKAEKPASAEDAEKKMGIKKLE